MNKIIALIAAVALSITPVYALTFEQVQGELGGTSCSGSVCSSHETGTRTFDNPDIVTETTQTDQVFKTENRSFSGTSACPLIRTMNGGWARQTNVNADCVANSIAPAGGGFSAVKRKVITTLDGGTTTIDTCTTNNITISYNPADGFGLSSEKSTSDGSC